MDSIRTMSARALRRRRNSSVGAVVVGGDYLGLGIVRSLGRQGVPTCILDDEYSIARFSRYVDHSVRVPSLLDAHDAVEALLDMGRRYDLQGWVLYPTRDETVAAISRYRSVLSEVFRVPIAEWSSIQHVWDKRNTYGKAEELGIPIPRTWYPRNESDLEAIAGHFPVAIKPAIKEHFFYATKAKAWRADNPEQLAARFGEAAALLKPGETMVQEFIPGDGREQFGYGAFFKDGRAIGSMVACRRRQHPPEFGRASTYVETVDIPELETLSDRFLRAIDFYGLVEVEFKRDPRDGVFKLLDVNARAWGYHSLGGRAGVDFPHLLYADQLSQPVAPCRAQPGIRWMRLATDLPTAVVEIRNGRLDPRAYLASVWNSHTEAVFSSRDPLPSLAELLLIPYLSVKRGF